MDVHICVTWSQSLLKYVNNSNIGVFYISKFLYNFKLTLRNVDQLIYDQACALFKVRSLRHFSNYNATVVGLPGLPAINRRTNMKNYHSKPYFALPSFLAIVLSLTSYSSNSAAAASDSDGNDVSSTTTQLAYAADGLAVDGYKSVKFGMDVTELKSMGYKCPTHSKTICTLDHGIKNEQTLLGKEAKPMVWVDQDKVRRIDVSVKMKPKDVLNGFKESFGEPEVYRYISTTHNLIEAYYWVSPSGTSVSLTRDFGKVATTTGEEVAKASSRVKYQNEERTLKSIKYMKKREVPTDKVIGRR